MSWKDDLEKNLRTPADDAADAARKEAEAVAEAKRIVAEARALAYRMLYQEAPLLLGAKFPQGTVDAGTGADGYFVEVLNKKLCVDTADDGQTLVVKRHDGTVSRYVVNRLKHGLVDEKQQQVGVDIENVLGAAVNSLAVEAKKALPK